MQQGKKLFAGLLAFVMLLGAFPVQALATETEECTHQYEATVVVPTCIQGGYTEYTCVHCGDTYTDEETDPTGVCVPKAVDEQPATCVQEGTAAHYACPDCGKKYLDEAATLPAADADLVLPLTACDITYVPGAQATCQHIGVRLYFVCEICDTKYLDAAGKQKVTDYEAEVLLPITECELSYRLEVPATCQQTGVAPHRYCIHCGKLYWNDEARTPVADEAELVLPIGDHSFGDWEVVEFPAPEQAGKEIRTCKYCGLQEEQEIPGLTWDLETPVLKVKQDKETGMPLLSWNEVPGAEAYVVCRMREEDLDETQEIKLEVLGATMATEVIDISADPGVSYLYTVYALSSTSYSDISDLKAGIAKCAAPELDVTTDAATGKAVLSWNAVEGAQNYEIYRSTSSSSGYKKVATTQDCSWTMTSGTTGSKYYYKVKAVCSNTAGNSNYSDVISHVCACPQPVAEIQSGETKGIKLTWAKVPGAKKYQIFRADSLNGLYTYIATTSNAYYTDTKAPANQVSYYKVAAYGSSTNSLSVRSEPVWLMNHTFGSWETILPAMPETEGWKERTCSHCGHVEGAAIPVLKRSLSTPKLTLSTNSDSGKPYLSWGKIDGATKYYIYQVDTATGERTYLTETTVRKYTVEDAQVGNTYSYQIMAISATKCSGYSTVKTVVCKCPKPAVSFTSDPVSGKPIAQWEPVEGALTYELYRATSSSGTYKKVATTQETSVMVDSSAAGKTYYYRLKAIGETAATTSANSASVKYMTKCAQPVIAAQSGETGGIKLTWDKVTGAKKYQVFRADSLDGEYIRIITTSKAYYTDIKAPANQVSYYKVAAYGESTSSLSVQSEAVSYTNHTFGGWVTIVPGMPETEGWKERTCSHCGHVEGAVIPVLKRSLSTPKLTLAANADSGKPYLSWGKVDGATKYYIYQVDTATGERTYLAETTTRKYTVEDAIVGESYAYQILAVSATKCSAYSAAKTVVCKCPKPAVSFTSDPVSGKPIAQWEPVVGALTYELYRATSSSGTYKLVATTQETSVVVDGSTAGKTYYYRLKAIGETTATTSASSASVKYVTKCAQPVIRVENGDTGGIRISWEKVEGAKKYQVYRANSLDGTYTRITTTSSLGYTDTTAPKNQEVFYKVAAYGESTASLSAESQVASVVNHTFSGWQVLYPATPEEMGMKERVCSVCGHSQQKDIPVLEQTLTTPAVSIAAETDSGKPTLSWKAVSKATGYRIYLVEESTGQTKFLEQITETAYAYKDAEPGIRYSFCVVAVNSSKCSGYSPAVSALCKCAVPQVQIQLDKQTGALTLSWEAAEGVLHYDVYRSNMSNGGFTLYTSTQENSVVVEDSVAGVSEYFRIQAIHPQNEEANSKMSAVVTLDGTTTEVVIHAGWVNDTCNKIVWSRVKGASTYAVTRATAADGVYTKVATVKGAEHVDLKKEAGITYYYKVTAYDKDEKVLSVSQPDAADKKCVVPVKIYVSPSSQPENKYSYGNTNEQKECQKIAQALVEALERCGFAAMTNYTDDMYGRMPESNAWGANLHVPIHSNAFNGSAKGTQVYHDGVSGSNSRKAARNIYDCLAPLSPGTSGETIKKHAGLYEFNNSQNPTAYIEVAFHDTKEEAKWIINNTQKIAEAICKGICKTYGFRYIAP